MTLLQQLAQQALGGSAVSTALEQDIQDKAVLIHGPPEPMLLPRNGDHHLIEMPPIAQPRKAPADAIGIFPPERLSPAPNRFVADLNPTRGQHLLDHAQAQGKAEIEPDCKTDHLGGRTMQDGAS